MGITGIGTDIVATARIRRIFEQYGERFARRILSGSEFEAFLEANDPVRFLAKRFAAKEAASKAMGSGFRQGISFTQMSVSHDVYGKPELCFSGAALDWLNQRSVARTHLSLSDEAAYAVAFVVMEAALPPAPTDALEIQ